MQRRGIHGNLTGLKPSQCRDLERIYRRRIPPERVVTPELARALTEISARIRRQVGVLADRKGTIRAVVVGDGQGLLLPDLERYRTARTRLSGLRLVHTHLRGEALTQDDLTDLALLRLDLVAAVAVGRDGLPGPVHVAHLLPAAGERRSWKVLDPVPVHALDLRFLPWVQELEAEMARTGAQGRAVPARDRAILVRATAGRRGDAEESMEELCELARTDGIAVLGTVIQHLPRIDPRYVVGRGKLKEIVISAMQAGANLVVFDQELTPGQARSIASLTSMRVIDRTQLILDIFAQHALSREGKVQVELAQLRYLLPRLTEQDAGLSRLTGGIGGRGPGETKLEIGRRRTRERIHRLERQLRQMNRGRNQRRARRLRNRLPIVSIVGYTNAGKSTLLNALTKSRVLVEDKLFATLDTATRRLRFPREREVIVTDTVGFIRNLPRDLLGAFRATLSELHDADLLLHVADLSNPAFPDQIRAVERILADLDLLGKPSLLVLNKADRVPPQAARTLARRYHGVAVSALHRTGLDEVTRGMEQILWGTRRADTPAAAV